jgi:hypothetical protein
MLRPFHEKFYTEELLFAPARENLRLAEENRRLEAELASISGGGVVGRIYRDARALVDTSYAAQRSMYKTLIRDTKYRVSPDRYRKKGSAEKFKLYRQAIDEEHARLTHENRRLRDLLMQRHAQREEREAQQRAQQEEKRKKVVDKWLKAFKGVQKIVDENQNKVFLRKWVDILRDLRQDADSKRFACTYGGLIQTSGTCWMNAMLNSIFLNRHMRLLLWKKWNSLPIAEKRDICGPHYRHDTEAYEVTNKKTKKVTKMGFRKADAGSPCRSHATCVGMPSKTQATTASWNRTVRHVVFAMFINMIASRHANRQALGSHDFVKDLAIMYKLNPAYRDKTAAEGEVWSDDNAKILKKATKNWKAHLKTETNTGGDPNKIHLLLNAILAEEMKKGAYLVIPSGARKSSTRDVDYQSRIVQVTTFGMPYKMICSQDRTLYRLSSCTISMALSVVDMKKNTIFDAGHVIAGFECEGAQYLYDANIDYELFRRQQTQYGRTTNIGSHGMLVRSEWMHGDLNGYISQALQVYTPEKIKQELFMESRHSCVMFFYYGNCIYTPVTDTEADLITQSKTIHLVECLTVMRDVDAWVTSASAIVNKIYKADGMRNDRGPNLQQAVSNIVFDEARFAAEELRLRTQLKSIRVNIENESVASDIDIVVYDLKDVLSAYRRLQRMWDTNKPTVATPDHIWSYVMYDTSILRHTCNYNRVSHLIQLISTLL